MKHSIDTVTLQKTLDYLATRPFNEVYGLIKGIQDTSSAIEPLTGSGSATAIPTTDSPEVA